MQQQPKQSWWVRRSGRFVNWQWVVIVVLVLGVVGMIMNYAQTGDPGKTMATLTRERTATTVAMFATGVAYTTEFNDLSTTVAATSTAEARSVNSNQANAVTALAVRDLPPTSTSVPPPATATPVVAVAPPATDTPMPPSPTEPPAAEPPSDVADQDLALREIAINAAKQIPDQAKRELVAVLPQPGSGNPPKAWKVYVEITSNNPTESDFKRDFYNWAKAVHASGLAVGDISMVGMDVTGQRALIARLTLPQAAAAGIDWSTITPEQLADLCEEVFFLPAIRGK